MPVFETIFAVISGGLWAIKYILERKLRREYERLLIRMLLAWEMLLNPEALALGQARRGVEWN